MSDKMSKVVRRLMGKYTKTIVMLKSLAVPWLCNDQSSPVEETRQQSDEDL